MHSLSELQGYADAKILQYFPLNFPVGATDYPTQSINYPIGETNYPTHGFNYEQCRYIEALVRGIIARNDGCCRPTAAQVNRVILVFAIN